MKRAGVSLIECMVCCVALSIALALCVKLMLVGMKWHAYTEDMADMYRHSAVLQDAWRESVGAKALSAWSVENGGLSAGSLQIRVEDDAFRLLDGETVLRTAPVPKGLDCRMTLEKTELGACAVLDMVWVATRNAGSETNRLRVVAMGARE